ncbi:MAG TPA: TolC family protein [Vicinamibacterales bacterium]|nr:TolC family protein [Vicinamibacterales bacterium]
MLTLEEALRLAGATSEHVAIAEAGIARAEGDRMRARSLTRPQLAGSASYDRALASEFSGLFDSAGPPCPALDIDATRPLIDRVAEIERALDCGAVGGFSFGGGDDEDGGLPFGRRNTWRANLTFTQGVYSGGRVGAARALAEASYSLADATLSGARAQLALDVTRAYYDAALADRLVTIAEASYAQANALFEQARTMFEAGSRPEFERLRAEVARDNQLPLVIRARSQRDIAYLRLRQLLDLPPGPAVQLEAGLTDTALPPPAVFAGALAAAGEVALAAAATGVTRSAVRQAEASVALSDAALSVAKAQRMPTVSVVSNLGEVAYPGGLFPTGWRTNWTVGASMSVPILTGGRLTADEMVAAADVAASRARLQQTRELTALDSETARQELIAAEATWTASAGTVAQARRAYEIAELRYREGISTQLELADSRLALESAEANRAQAARDLQVARARLALLPNLPLSLTGR